MILVAVLVVGLAVAPVREAVADWLGIGSTHVVKVPGGVDTTGLPSIQEGLAPVSRDEAERALTHPVPIVDALGEPRLLVLSPEGGVIMGWTEGDTTLWVRPSGVDPKVFLQKLVAVGEHVEPVEGWERLRSMSRALTCSRRPVGSSLPARCCCGCRTASEYRLESDLESRRDDRRSRSRCRRARTRSTSPFPTSSVRPCGDSGAVKWAETWLKPWLRSHQDRIARRSSRAKRPSRL